MNDQYEKSKRSADMPTDVNLEFTVHKKKARVFLLTDTDRRKLSEVEVINSMKKIPEDIVGRTRVEYAVDALNVLEDTKSNLKEEKVKLMKKYRDLMNEDQILKTELKMFKNEAKILKRRREIYMKRKEFLEVELVEVKNEKILIEERCEAVENTKIFFKEEKISVEEELSKGWDSLPFWNYKKMQLVNQCLNEVNEQMDNELSDGKTDVTQEVSLGVDIQADVSSVVVSEDGNSRSAGSIGRWELSAEDGLFNFIVVDSPEGSFDSTEVELSSSPMSMGKPGEGQSSLNLRSVMFDTLKKLIKYTDGDAVEVASGGDTAQSGNGVMGVVVEKNPVAAAAEFGNRMVECNSFGMYEEDSVSAAAKFKNQLGEQDWLNKDDVSLNDSVIIIDSE